MADAPRDPLDTAMQSARRQGIDTNPPVGTTIGPRIVLDDATRPFRLGEPPLPRVGVHEGDGPAPTGTSFVIKHLIGRGGVANVYSADHVAMQRTVAVKQLQPSMSKPETTAGLVGEARLAGRLEHPNILPIHAVLSRDDGNPIIVMKRVEGVDWHTLLAQPEHPEWSHRPGDRLEENLAIFVQVCRALEYAHSRGILHLDIKPGNVMVGGFGEVYLMDWGLAIDLDRRDELPSEELVGTPSYLAPELLMGRRDAVPATDIYLLGATLHSALTGEGRHNARDLRSRLHQAMVSEPHDYDASVPAELGALCNRACAARIGDRFASVRHVREAVEEFLRHRTSNRLAAAAQAQLDELRDLSERTYRNRWDGVGRRERRQALATSSRFGFEQALADWPRNERARAGRERALEELIELELEREHPEGAAALMEQLASPRPDLERRHEQLLDRLDSAGDAARRLRALERDISFAGDDARHSLTIAFNGTVWSIVALLWGEATRRGITDNSPSELLTLAIGGTAVLALFLAVIWKHVVDNQIRRRFVIAFIVYIATFDVTKLAALLADLPLETVILTDHAVLISFTGFAAALISPVCFVAVGVAVAACLATAVRPDLLFEIAAVDLFVINAIFAWAVRPRTQSSSS